MRFQNYQAEFTILNEVQIDGTWIREILSTRVRDLSDPRTPKSLKKWCSTGVYSPLKVDPKKIVRSISAQLPSPGIETELVSEIITFCRADPYKFETVAIDLWQKYHEIDMEIELTPKFKDKGRDALGSILLGPGVDPIKINFVLEAKCYALNQRVNTKHTSRLISRIKQREFGVLITTAAVDTQAYFEVRSDNHPLIFITGKDIAKLLISKGINSSKKVNLWLETLNYLDN